MLRLGSSKVESGSSKHWLLSAQATMWRSIAAHLLIFKILWAQGSSSFTISAFMIISVFEVINANVKPFSGS